MRFRLWDREDIEQRSDAPHVSPEMMDALAERDEQVRPPRRRERRDGVFGRPDEEPLTMSFPLHH